MSNSSLISYTRISPNYNPRKKKIRKITIHHAAGRVSVESLGNSFASPARQASANYGIGYDGRIGMYVEESGRAWTSSNAENDHQAVTIEVSNDGGAPDWHVSDSVLERLIELCTDICRRNGIVSLNYTGDKNGIVLSDPVYGEGNMKVPAGGYVLSGHGEAGKWLYGHVKQGYLAGVYDGTVKIEEACCRSLDGVDTGRGTDQLIAYTRGRTGTNRYGWEVCIVDGVATSDAIYGNGNIWVGEGTYVLSGHGEAGRWLYGHVKKGTRVDVDTRYGFVRVR